MWCKKWPLALLFLFLHLLPRFQPRILDVKKLALLLDNKSFFGNRRVDQYYSTGFSSHNMSACAFRFHGSPFLNVKEVTLSNETYFKGRTRCSVEFYNLPKGIIRLSVLDQHRFISQSCDAAPDSKSWPILDVVVAGSNNPVRFCIVSHIKKENDDDKKEKFSRIATEGGRAAAGVVGGPGSQEIAANFQQKLLFDLKFWNGSALHFHYQPYPMDIRSLYETTKPRTTTRLKHQAWIVTTGEEPTQTIQPIMDQDIDFQYKGDCQRQGKIVCQQSMRCADQDLVQEEKLDDHDDTQLEGCKDKKFLCLNRSALCNGKFECGPHDRTDERNCSFLTNTTLYILLGMTLFIAVTGSIFYYRISQSCRNKSSNAENEADEATGGRCPDQDNFSVQASINVVVPRGNSINMNEDEEEIQKTLYPSLLNKP